MEGSKIGLTFKKLGGRKAFIPFITCGYPDMDKFLQLFSLLAETGADIIEIGLPFSDPLADGPVIQETSRVALENGVNADILFSSVKEIRKKHGIPIAVMTYFNPVYNYGIEDFLKKCKRENVDGLIIPDLPLEEYWSFNHYFKRSKIDNIMLASLTSSNNRLKKIAEIGRGFLYCVSVKGITGIRPDLREEVKGFLTSLREITKLPLALGFGLSNKKQIAEIKDYCDGIIIGSKILSTVIENKDFGKALGEIESFTMEIEKILKS